jgi:hypothetical protein
MPGQTKQAKAVSHIRELLGEREVEVAARRFNLPDAQQWVIFERNGPQVRVDTTSDIWLRESAADEWRCVAIRHSTSGISWPQTF